MDGFVRAEEHGQMEEQRQEGEGTSGERWVLGLVEECSVQGVVRHRLEEEGVRAGHRGHGHLAREWHSP